MSFNYYLTMAPVVADLLSAHPYIRAGAHLTNLVGNFFPKALPIGSSILSNPQEQDKLDRIQKIVQELVQELDVRNTPIQVRVSSLFDYEITYMGGAHSIDGAVLYIGQKIFDQFDSAKHHESDLVKEWQTELAALPGHPLDFNGYLNHVSDAKKERITQLASRFKHTYSESEFKALLAKEIKHIVGSDQLSQTGFAAHKLLRFQALRYLAPLIMGGTFLFSEYISTVLRNDFWPNLPERVGPSAIRTLTLIDVIKYGVITYGSLFYHAYALRSINRHLTAEDRDADRLCLKTPETSLGLLEHYKKQLIETPHKKGNRLDKKFDVWREELVPEDQRPAKKKVRGYGLVDHIIYTIFRPISTVENLFADKKVYLMGAGTANAAYQIFRNLNPFV